MPTLHADPPLSTQSQDPLATFRAPPHAATLALVLYLAGMTVAFAWLLVGYTLMKGRGDLPVLSLPLWFWLSTALAVVGSLMIHWAWLGARGFSKPTVQHGLSAALVLGVLFLVGQVLGFLRLIAMHTELAGAQGLVKLVFILALLHGMHLIVGLGYLLIHTTRSYHKAYEPDPHHVKLLMIYWHYLTLLWVAIFTALTLAPGAA